MLGRPVSERWPTGQDVGDSNVSGLGVSVVKGEGVALVWMGHTHTWRDHPPEGPLSWDKTWDEQYFDTEALAENKEVKSEDYTLDILYTLELDPKSRFDEQFWPEVVEWCSVCREHRRVIFVNQKVLEKVQALDGKEDEVFSKVTLENEIEAELQEQVDRKVRKEVVTEEEKGLKIEED